MFFTWKRAEAILSGVRRSLGLAPDVSAHQQYQATPNVGQIARRDKENTTLTQSSSRGGNALGALAKRSFLTSPIHSS